MNVHARTTHKTCSKCGERKPLGDFSVSDTGKHRRSSYCKECNMMSKREQRALNINRTSLSGFRRGLSGFGAMDGAEPLRTGVVSLSLPAPTPPPIRPLSNPIPCPCCGQGVRVPTLEIVIDRYDIRPAEARVLRAIWRGKGHPVMPERVFDVMYEDDPDGGPRPGRMYSDFKVFLHRLRGRLEGSGIKIVNCGYRRGYRLVIGE